MEENNGRVVYYSSFTFKGATYFTVATSKGLCYVGSPNQPLEETIIWLNKHLPDYQLVEDHQQLTSYQQELIRYLSGDLSTFTFDIELIGTAFQQLVWRALQDIPYGRTMTYSEVAKIINRPTAVRAVGRAIGANPLLIVIPCHRVISKDGQLSGFRAGLAMKTMLLTLEQTETA
ncbi:methylated-DNA--[protein]-cysteine S-methyltransferase [Amphibacillus cookii]|uniref:methylated-DNA--[protein]-cysteine S-methyltransferase n=1 Tax=Amphibacillus cookii TaxID=767787 RepID=UPI0019574BB2|nr:methylated-DNA--[protein]-cysteine S-methyltransferase [Amphibacillus cookii]MBM7542582.1 methylated-DNA-[protein]-cysteine S-methyltransferase [Amphibacillus cookii]